MIPIDYLSGEFRTLVRSLKHGRRGDRQVVASVLQIRFYVLRNGERFARADETMRNLAARIFATVAIEVSGLADEDVARAGLELEEALRQCARRQHLFLA